VPSLTEVVFALGAGDSVAGVTRYCVEPAEAVRPLPRVGGTKSPDLAAILDISPDLVLASIEENRAEDVAALRAAGVSVFVTHFPTVVSALDGIDAIAALLGVDTALDWLFEARAAVQERCGYAGPAVPYFCPIWRRPYMVARRDTYMADLLALAGGVSALPEDGPAHYFPIDLDALSAAAPAVILLPDEPYPFAPKHLKDFEASADVPAVKNGRIHLVDGKAITWYGPRIAPALWMLDALLHAPAAGDVARGEPAGRL